MLHCLMDYESRNKVFDRAIFPEAIRESTRDFKDVMGYIYLIQKKFSPDTSEFSRPLNLIKVGCAAGSTCSCVAVNACMPTTSK